MNLSVIAPVYNEGEIIIEFYKTLDNTLKKENIKYEVIFIDDGSVDDSLIKLKQISKNTNVKIISFSRNFGKEAAIYAGLKNSNGKYTCIIDTDLQQHPKYLIDMYNELEKNNDIDEICMVPKTRIESKLVNCCKNIGYKLLSKITKLDMKSGASDFRMFRKNVLNSILMLGEKNRFSKGIFSWIGFNISFMEYKVLKRKAGKTSWSIRGLFSYGIDGFIGFTTKPLRLSTYIGLLSSFIAFIYFVIIVLQTLIIGKDLPGYPSLMCAILFMGGIQLLCLGIVGEYLAKTFIETKNRPIYIEKERINLDDKEN